MILQGPCWPLGSHPPHPMQPLARPPALCSYAAIFKHAKDELGFCYYLIPCGKDAKKGQCGNVSVRAVCAGPCPADQPSPTLSNSGLPCQLRTTRTRIPPPASPSNISSSKPQETELKQLHENAIKHDPFISRAMGPNPKCERMRAGSLRVGGQGERGFVSIWEGRVRAHARRLAAPGRPG